MPMFSMCKSGPVCRTKICKAGNTLAPSQAAHRMRQSRYAALHRDVICLETKMWICWREAWHAHSWSNLCSTCLSRCSFWWTNSRWLRLRSAGGKSRLFTGQGLKKNCSFFWSLKFVRRNYILQFRLPSHHCTLAPWLETRSFILYQMFMVPF